MWSKRLLENRFVLPVASAAFLILAFHPFTIWPLVFVALTPLFYFVVAAPTRPLKEVFLGGFITGSIFALSLSYFTVIQFHWIPATYVFVDAVRLLFIPLSLVGGALCGGALVSYRLLSSNHAPLNVAVNAAVYVLGEMLLYALCGGYYFAMLAYAVAPLPFLVRFAGIGGAFFVSFIVALVNALVAGYLAGDADVRRILRFYVLGIVGVLVILGAGFTWYMRVGEPVRTLSVAIVQDSGRDSVVFGHDQKGVFSSPTLEAQLKTAATPVPDLLIYPFSPIEGAFYRGVPQHFNQPILAASQDEFTRWTASRLPASTTLMIWTTLYTNNTFNNVFQFIKDGVLQAEYSKRARFPFLDYTPQWAQKLGLYSTQVDMTAGPAEQPLVVAGIKVGALLCSEVQKQDFVRAESGHSLLIISAGSEAVFFDDIASRYSLIAAQYRAAESGLPVIRANLLGPSGVSDRYGALMAYAPRGEAQILRTSIPLYDSRATPYSWWGNVPVVVLVLLILGGAFWVRRNAYTVE